MTTKYLDSNGLLYLWQKIRNTFVSDVTWDSTNKKLIKKKKTGTSGAEESTDLVTFATVATSGSYNDLSSKPSTATTSANGLMSSSDKTKLDGIASGAEVNVQSNWTQTTTTADDYIKNKPTIGAAAAKGVVSSISADSTDLPTVTAVKNYVASEAPKELFIAQYGVTPFADVLSAFQNGEIIVAEIVSTYAPATFLPMVHAGTVEIHFGSIQNGTMYYATVDSTNGWNSLGASAMAKLNSPAFTGTPTAPTAASGTTTTQIATTEFVHYAVDTAITGVAAYQGIASYPFGPVYSKAGWYWIIDGPGTYCGQTCEAGDMIFCRADASSYSASNFDIVQTNLDITSITNAEIDTIVAA